MINRLIQIIFDNFYYRFDKLKAHIFGVFTLLSTVRECYMNDTQQFLLCLSRSLGITDKLPTALLFIITPQNSVGKSLMNSIHVLSI